MASGPVGGQGVEVEPGSFLGGTDLSSCIGASVAQPGIGGMISLCLMPNHSQSQTGWYSTGLLVFLLQQKLGLHFTTLILNPLINTLHMFTKNYSPAH